MTTTDIRKEIKDRLKNADDRLLKMIFALMREYEDAEDFDIPLSELKKAEKNLKLYKQGKMKGLSVSDVNARIRKRLKK